jgi:hypothetical protein
MGWSGRVSFLWIFNGSGFSQRRFPVAANDGIPKSLLRLGLATAEQVDIDTLETRLQDEAVAKQLTVFAPRWVGAWTRLP